MTTYELNVVVADFLFPLKIAAIALLGFLLLFAPDDDPPGFA